MLPSIPRRRCTTGCQINSEAGVDRTEMEFLDYYGANSKTDREQFPSEDNDPVSSCLGARTFWYSLGWDDLEINNN